MIYTIIWVHWVADFIFQTRKMATNKSTSWVWLATHIAAYTAFLLPFGWQFALANGAAHFVTDAITSRATNYLWKRQEIHKFFAVIGLDQAAHMTVLIATLPLMMPVWM